MGVVVWCVCVCLSIRCIKDLEKFLVRWLATFDLPGLLTNILYLTNPH